MNTRRTPEAAGVDSRAIQAFIDEAARLNARLHAVTICDREGVCFAEAARPYTLDTPHRLCSAAKSILALGLLRAAEEGRLALADRVLDYFPEYAPTDANMDRLTVEDLLTMRTGQTGDPFGLLFQDFDADLTEAFFHTPAEEAPGTRFRYNNTVPHIICQVTERAVGMPFETWFARRVSDALQAPLSAPTSAKGQYNPVVTSVSARSFTRYALLFLRRGDWFGRQLIGPEWIDLATREHALTEPGGDGYGYQIWRNPFGGYRMDGGWGQYALLLPEAGYAVTLLCDMTHSRPLLDAFARTLLPALGKGAAGEPAARAKLTPLAPDNIAVPGPVRVGASYRFEDGSLLTLARANAEGLAFSLTRGGRSARFAAGTGDRWLDCDEPLLSDTLWSIDTGVYGVADGTFRMSGGWVAGNAFECLGKTATEMGEHRYRFEFEGDELILRCTPGMVHDISTLEGAAVRVGRRLS